VTELDKRFTTDLQLNTSGKVLGSPYKVPDCPPKQWPPWRYL